MLKSPEAVIDSYMQNQYSNAIDYLSQMGKMKEELAKAMHAKEEAKRLQLETLVREEEFRVKIEAYTREREEHENFKNKFLELQSNIEQQRKSHEEMKQHLIEERERASENFDRRLEEIHKEMLEQLEQMRKENEKLKQEFNRRCVIL
ncbi:hypothetical protein C1645_750836 [Glomus cerebriforme]|uniref:Uncharacterized protein n=1 Tax=Glomus cerebriforme TaxID=658196 RepID=A0A397SEM6_9GLOM|nr:hypothetical protein C1645_791676 [Glomus cerebriforme]RIA98182.1 hypothetical protein C1645_750836 [Glomus cerebriforme]